jgi:hypothetical protein
MGRTRGRVYIHQPYPRLRAGKKANNGGEGIRLHHRTHLSSPDCWCNPIEESPGVWVHRLDPDVESYVPDLQGVIEGDDGPP